MRQQRHRQRNRQQLLAKTQKSVVGVGSQEKKEDDEHMGRNEDKYFYIRDVAFEKESWVLARFLQDAKDSSMLRSPGQHLIVRLGDYYREQDRLCALQARSASVEPGPVEMSSASSMAAAVTSSIESARRGKGKKTAAPVVEQPLSMDDFADVYDMDM